MVDSTTAENNETEVDIQAMLRRAEMIEMQLQMEARFKRNMAVFKANMPKVHDLFTDYEPKELRLEFSDEGYLHLINSQSGTPVYPENPEEFVQRQFEWFCASPSIAELTFEKGTVHNKEHIHQRIVNAWLDASEPLSKTRKISIDAPIGFMMVTGIGLGYHIEKISRELDVKYLCIFESQVDSLYASLHTIDWVPILEKYSTKEHQIYMYLDFEPAIAMRDLGNVRHIIGYHNFITSFIYPHLSDPQTQTFLDLYSGTYGEQGQMLGFFDDEQIGFAHTIHNINAGYAFFSHGAATESLPPVLLVGNGPSLDSHVNFIRQHQADSIIISCGTALSSLAKVGIKPDFHVEMERSSITPYYIEAGTSDEYRRGIPLLTLNPAPPNMTALFDEVCLAVKPNDAGRVLIDDTFMNHGLSVLDNCNPTVANAGLSFVLSMGFTEVLLIGVDLGQKTAASHHSSLSVYHDLEKRSKGKIRPGGAGLQQSLVPGNFGGEVYADWILSRSRREMEHLLSLPNPVGREHAVYNLNDGALINGAIPKRYSDLNSFRPLADKPAIISAIKNRNFKSLERVTLSDKVIDDQYLQSFRALRKSLMLPKKINRVDELHDTLNRIYSALNEASLHSPLSSHLLRGTIATGLGIIAWNLFFMGDKHLFKKHYETNRRFYMQLIKGAFGKMATDPLSPDNSVPPHVEEFTQSP
ncbi:DUF115 domain-containing protein [Pseudomonadales bacterium]|nr:DUF115 domain-containing protein [Pseudomonadales bacterium]